MAPPTLGKRAMSAAARQRRYRYLSGTAPDITAASAVEVARDVVDLQVVDAVWRQTLEHIDAQLRMLHEVAQIEPGRRSALSTIGRMRVALTKIG
jgi:hypothetical protein